MRSITLDPIIPPESSEKELEKILLAWFEENYFKPLEEAFTVDRSNSVNVYENEEWFEFPEWLEPLGYDRDKMPQIRSEEREALCSFLASRGIECRDELLLPDRLRPTQELYSADKLAKARAWSFANRPILCSSDLRILDGHHQWFARFLDRPEDVVPAIVFDARIPRLIREANLFPGAERNNAEIRKLPEDYAELSAAINSGRITYADGVFAGKFSAKTSRLLKGFGARFDRAPGVYRVDPAAIPFNLRGSMAAARVRAETINKAVIDVAAEIATEVAKAPSLGLKLERFTERLIDNVEEQFQASLAKGAAEVEDMETAVEFVATPPDFTPAAIADVRETLTNNLELSIKNFTDEQTLEIRKLAEENWQMGGRVDRLQELIEQRFGVAERKAAFLARNETSLVASEYARARAQDIGSTQYIWHTRHDDRVRHDHQELNGTTQSWDDPPVVDKANDRRRNPGGDYNCRCVARPVINLAARRIG